MILVKLINDATAHGLYAGEVAAFEDAVAERMIKAGRALLFETAEETAAKVAGIDAELKAKEAHMAANVAAGAKADAEKLAKEAKEATADAAAKTKDAAAAAKEQAKADADAKDEAEAIAKDEATAAADDEDNGDMPVKRGPGRPRKW
jgi:hypothetical protein